MITDEKVQEAIELHEAGITIYEICRRLKCSESGIGDRMKALGYDVVEKAKEAKRKKRQDFIDSVTELYPIMGTLEISDVLGTTQSSVQGALKNVVRRSRSEERKLNLAYRERVAKEQKTMICSKCREVCSEHESGLCGFCRDEEDECNITEHEAWLEFEASWGERRGNICYRNKRS